MTTISNATPVWFLWDDDNGNGKGKWMYSTAAQDPGTSDGNYLTFPDDALDDVFSSNPNAVVIHVRTNASYTIAVEILSGESVLHGPHDLSGSESWKVSLPANLGTKGASVAYAVKAQYEIDGKPYSADPRFTISRSN